MLRKWGIRFRRGYKKPSRDILAYRWLRCRWQPNLNLLIHLDDDGYSRNSAQNACTTRRDHKEGQEEYDTQSGCHRHWPRIRYCVDVTWFRGCSTHRGACTRRLVCWEPD